jgi:hypothetical protein
VPRTALAIAIVFFKNQVVLGKLVDGKPTRKAKLR